MKPGLTGHTGLPGETGRSEPRRPAVRPKPSAATSETGLNGSKGLPGEFRRSESRSLTVGHKHSAATSEPGLTGRKGLPGESRRSESQRPTVRPKPVPPEVTSLRELPGTPGNTGLCC